jgi:hypothetical protein
VLLQTDSAALAVLLQTDSAALATAPVDESSTVFGSRVLWLDGAAEEGDWPGCAEEADAEDEDETGF